MNNFFFLVFFYIISIINSSYIILPFETFKNKNEYSKNELNITDFYENYFSNIIFTSIEIGNQNNIVPIILTSNSYGLSIGYLCDNNFDNKNSLYNDKSTSFFRETNGLITYQQYEGGFYAKDSFTFFTDLENNSKNKKTVNNISFIYMPQGAKTYLKKEKICGIMGLSLKYVNYCEESRNIITNLNKLDIIQKYTYSIHYKDSNNGYILIGEEPHNIISNLFDEDCLRKANALSDGYDDMEWKTEFNQIYFYENGVKKKMTETKRVKFAIEINYMIGTNEFKKNIENSFFGKFLEKNICFYEKITNKRFSILICNKDPSFDIRSFPNFFFYHRIFNYTFELTKEELFLEQNNKYVFLVFFSDYDIKYYVLGKIFLKKYLLIFNQDSKTIGFYNQDLKLKNNIEKTSAIMKIFGIFIIIICSIIGFYLAKKIYENSRKKRINEINDQYEYNSYEKNNINYKDNDKNKIFLEMPSK